MCYFCRKLEICRKMFKNLYVRVRFRFQMLIIYLFWPYFSRKVLFYLRSYSILDAITLINRKNMIKMSMWAFRVFSDSGFCFCFQFFRSDDLNKDPKGSLNTLTPNLTCMWAWSMPIFWVLLVDLCAIMCVKM